MDSRQLIRFRANVEGQLRLIQKVYERLCSRVSDGLDTPSQLDSVAYQIHNFYWAIEALLKLVAGTFEDNIAEDGKWHQNLVIRLSKPIEGIRPVLLSDESLSEIEQLVGFRHFVRRGYDRDIELNLLRTNIAAAQKLCDLIDRDMNTFLSQLSSDDEK
ncbi:MAG: hypothetical protein AAFQ40_12625 [Cyanobacteria bacterium J06623_5]